MAGQTQYQSQSPAFLVRIVRIRTLVLLFGVICTTVLFSSWNLLKSVLSSHESNSSGWSVIYAAAVLGLFLGFLSMAAALVVAVPAILVTWITLLVLLSFCGKSRKALLIEGKKLTAEISGVVVRSCLRKVFVFLLRRTVMNGGDKTH